MALKEANKNYFTAEEIFHGRVKTLVAGKSDQVPEYNDIKNSGHEGGDFVFQTAKASVSGTEGYTAPLTPVEIKEPSGKDFKIDDLEKEAKEIEKNKAAWQTKLSEMKQAYGKVKTFEQGTSPADRKSSAWQRFLETFNQDNPYSQEDDTMRQEAEERISYWNSQQQIAMAPAKKLLDKITGKTFTDPSTNMEFVYVKGGCYQMGESYNAHEVCVDDYYIGKYEVTQAQWKAIKGNNPSSFKDCGDNCPVETVNWNDAQDFIQKLNQKTGKNYRLPTEAEWEYAARSSGKSEKYSGGNDIDSVAWYDKNSGGKTHPVGQKKPNGLGLYDMSGNVWEWVNDWYDGDYYKNSSKNNPTGPSSGKEKVVRGGSWFNAARYAEAALWGGSVPTLRDSDKGFRLVVPVR
jgi:formylglycine-generating enzyme required for sulfatase activity